MLNIAYDAGTRRAILTWDNSARDAEWVRLIRRVFLDHTEDVTQLSSEAISLPWWTFLSARSQVKEVLSGYRISLNVDAATPRGSIFNQGILTENSY